MTKVESGELLAIVKMSAERLRAERAKSLEEKRKREKVVQLCAQGVRIASEYEEEMNALNRISDRNYNYPLTSHPVILEIEGEEVTFEVRASLEKPSGSLNVDDLLSSELKSVSIHSFLKVESHNFARVPLFHMDNRLGRLVTPEKEDNDPEAIKAASDLLNVIQQSLSTTHTPRSQRITTQKSGKLRRLSTLFRHAKAT